MKSTHKIRFSAITQLKGIFSCFLLTSVISLNVSAQEIDCEKVKNNRTSYVRKGSVTSELDDSTRWDMKIFETCGGWDEIDKKIFEWPNILNISLDYCDIGEDETYGQILYGVTLYKLSEEYKQARNKAIQELKASEEAKNPKKIHEVTNQKTELVLQTAQKSGVFYQLNDLASALEAGKAQQKRVLIYFTCWACVNARKIEDRVLSDEYIQTVMKENYLCFSAYTDDRAKMQGSDLTIGEVHSRLQLETFSSTGAPHFYVVDEIGKVIVHSAYVLTTGEFEAFLKEGLK